MKAEVKKEVEKAIRFAEKGVTLTSEQAQRFVYAA